VLHPGAAAAARRWPAQRWAQVARTLLDRGHPVVLTGSTDERARCQRIADDATGSGGTQPAVLAGRTSVAELAALVAHADVVISNDTGVAHLATTYETASVVIFGPTPPDEWGPPPTGPHLALWSGRRGDPHGATAFSGLLEIEVGQVLGAALGLLANGLRLPVAATVEAG
jgi:ADP-heptose:LPS heptosyltransferase